MVVTSDRLSRRSAGGARAGIPLAVPLAVVWFVGAWVAGVPTSHTAASSPATVSEASSADSGATYSGEYSVGGRQAHVQLASRRLPLSASTSASGQSQPSQGSDACGIFQPKPQLFQLYPACGLYSTPADHTLGGGNSPAHSTGGGHSPIKYSGRDSSVVR